MDELIEKWTNLGFLTQESPNKESIVTSYEIIIDKLKGNKNFYHPKLSVFIFPVLYRIGIHIELNNEITELILNDFIEALQNFDVSLTDKYRENNIDYETIFLASYADHFILNFKNTNDKY